MINTRYKVILFCKTDMTYTIIYHDTYLHADELDSYCCFAHERLENLPLRFLITDWRFCLFPKPHTHFGVISTPSISLDKVLVVLTSWLPLLIRLRWFTLRHAITYEQVSIGGQPRPIFTPQLTVIFTISHISLLITYVERSTVLMRHYRYDIHT